MSIVLWVLQAFLAVYFIYTGTVHFNPPANLPFIMEWMHDLPSWLHVVIGIAEILGGIGLVLPAATRIQTRLVVLAAAGLVLVMVGAAVFHIFRGEFPKLGMNIGLGTTAAFVAYGRWRLKPFQARAPASSEA